MERQNSTLLRRLKIAHREGKDWRAELATYLLQYRSLPHPTTGVSPGKLMFNRELRTKMPQLKDHVQVQEVRDRDAESKQKSKDYADKKRGAVPSVIQVGDKVLVRSEGTGDKLTTPLNPDKFTVLDRDGAKVTIQGSDGGIYDRNVSVMKQSVAGKEGVPSESESVSDNSIVINDVNSDMNNARPRRERKAPQRYGDFVTK